MASGFYDDRRFCPHCQTDVQYLDAVDAAYCVQCGNAIPGTGKGKRKGRPARQDLPAEEDNDGDTAEEQVDDRQE